jgi:hypothetical protein
MTDLIKCVCYVKADQLGRSVGKMRVMKRWLLDTVACREAMLMVSFDGRITELGTRPFSRFRAREVEAKKRGSAKKSESSSAKEKSANTCIVFFCRAPH